MGVFVSVVSFPLGLVRWLFDGLQFGRHKPLAIRERAQLERLLALETNQLRSLEGLNSRLISVFLDSVSLEVGESPALEPVVSVQVRMFNGTVFNLKPGESTFSLSFDENRLSMAYKLVSRPSTLHPGGFDTFQFRQPVQELTAEKLRNLRNDYQPLNWRVEFSIDLFVVEPEINYTLTDNSLTLRHIPLPP